MPGNTPPSKASNPSKAFERLLAIVQTLRAECPWDKKQTSETLRHLTIEETYELADAILERDKQAIKEELGDLLLHLVFYAQIASESADFTITDVLNGICDKLIHRHPHVYGDVKALDEYTVKQNWEQLKLKEGNSSVLSGVPRSLPALIKASRIQEKVSTVGFDWEKKEQVWEKIAEEIKEFREEFNTETQEIIDQEKAEAEFGDLLFSLVNYARFIHINPENALEKTNKKFIKRFQYVENQAKFLGKNCAKLTLTEMNTFWNEAKDGK